MNENMKIIYKGFKDYLLDKDEFQKKIFELTNKQAQTRLQHLEIFSTAYLNMTNLNSKDVVLVEEQIDNVITWRFEPKSKFNFKEEDDK